MGKKHIIAARILFILYLAALAWLCFGDFSSLPSVSKTIFGIETDKVVHFLMFFPFPFLLFVSFGVLPCRPLKVVLFVFLALCLGCATGAVTEFVQGMTPTRVPDIRDFFADVAGSVSSAVVTLLIFVPNAK